MIKPDALFKKIEDQWVSRLILDEIVIMPLCKSEEDMLYIYSIANPAGVRIWQLLDGQSSVSDIQQLLEAEYPGKAKAIAKDLNAFLADLEQAKLIRSIRTKPKASSSKPKTNPRASKRALAKGVKKTPYQTPEIVKIKMQPEQAVLSCCNTSFSYNKTSGFTGVCSSSQSCIQGCFGFCRFASSFGWS